MVDVRGLADEERVELGDVRGVVGADEPRVDPKLARRSHEAPQGLGIGWGVDALGRGQDGEVVAEGPPRPGRPLPATEVLLGLLDHELAMALRHFARGDGPHGQEPPLPRAHLEARAQERHRKLRVERSRQRVVALGEVSPEVDGELESGALESRQAPLDQVFDLLRHEAHDGGETQVLERLDGGDRAVAPRRREERHVVAERLIAVRATEVVDAEPTAPGPRVAHQVVAGRDHLGSLEAKRPAARVLDHQDRPHGVFSGGSSTSRLAS
jgi:hypothetical protein